MARKWATRDEKKQGPAGESGEEKEGKGKHEGSGRSHRKDCKRKTGKRREVQRGGARSSKEEQKRAGDEKRMTPFHSGRWERCLVPLSNI